MVLLDTLADLWTGLRLMTGRLLEKKLSTDLVCIFSLLPPVCHTAVHLEPHQVMPGACQHRTSRLLHFSRSLNLGRPLPDVELVADLDGV